MSQHGHECGQDHPEGGPIIPRSVTIVRTDHPLGRDGWCSCCHGPASTGVLAYKTRDIEFDPFEHPWIFWCGSCADKIGGISRE